MGELTDWPFRETNLQEQAHSIIPSQHSDLQKDTTLPPASASKQPVAETSSASSEVPRKSRRRKTAHLKIVPETREMRERIRAQCGETAARLDKTLPLTKEEMEALARSLLESMDLPEGYVGWTMVVLASSFWKDQVAATHPSRRLLLLPHCLKHAEGCPADYDEFGLDCERCGACSIADFRGQAEQMGYRVLVAEGSPIVLKIIVSGHVDAIVGVACLNVLEKAIDKVLLAGVTGQQHLECRQQRHEQRGAFLTT